MNALETGPTAVLRRPLGSKQAGMLFVDLFVGTFIRVHELFVNPEATP